jgi:replicative DNA helicase
MAAVLADHEQECAVLGCILISQPILGIVSERLSPDHFHDTRNSRIFAAMLSLYDKGDDIDWLTVGAELKRANQPVENDYLAGLADAIPVLTNARHYARRVIELAELRTYQAAGRDLIVAAERENRDDLALIEGRLLNAQPSQNVSLSPEALSAFLLDALDQTDPETFPYPIPSLNRCTAGGLRRGEVLVVGGWPNHGKSPWLDQVLAGWCESYPLLRGHLYINEMTRQERGKRRLAAMTLVPYGKIRGGELNIEEHQKIVGALEQRLPFGMTDCAGWSAQEIARDIRRNRWDFVGLDIFHNIPGLDDANKIKEGFLEIKTVTAETQGNCALICAVHLNRNRMRDDYPPRPGMGDILGSGAFDQLADQVMFVHRDPDNENTPSDLGSVYFTKVRGGVLGAARVHFQGKFMTFYPVNPGEAKAA